VATCTNQLAHSTQRSHLADPRCHDDLLNYRLKRLLTLGSSPAIRLCEGQYGVARVEWRLIAALVEEGAVSPSELAARVALDPGRVTRTLQSLEHKSLVRRAASRDRHKRVSVAATESGRALYKKLWPGLAAINRRLVAALDKRELEVFERCLVKLTAQAKDVLEDAAAAPVKTHRRLGGSRRVWEASERKPV
jgi:DNA-binding MarR family transcriptional regulator